MKKLKNLSLIILAIVGFILLMGEMEITNAQDFWVFVGTKIIGFTLLVIAIHFGPKDAKRNGKY